MRRKASSYPGDVEQRISLLEGEGKTVVLVAREGQIIGLIAIADTLKQTTPAAIAAFKKLGLRSS